MRNSQKKAKMLDPIFERQSKIAKVIDETFKCYKKEALEKAKKLSNKQKLKFFSIKLFKIPILVHENGQKRGL